MASLDELRAERLKKLTRLKEAGMVAYPVETGRSMALNEAVENFDSLVATGAPITLAGRVMALRGQGAIIFFDLDDGGGKFQALIKKEETDETAKKLFEETVDLGDIVAVTGELFLTKRAEKTILVKTWQMLTKTLRPLPDQWDGLKDTEERFRRRYLDSLINVDVRKRFTTRSNVISEIRSFLNKQDFLEVETPMLQPLPGGATATPFVTHHAALDIDLYLRVAPELYLKQMVIGGFNKVYELGRNFRNEGIDTTHNPEFTSIEVYAAYSTPTEQRELVEDLFKKVIKKVFGSTKLPHAGELIDFSKKFGVIKYFDLFRRYALIPEPETISEDELKIKAEQLGIRLESGDSREKLLDRIYKKTCQPKLIQPTFITDYPFESAPLAKRQEDNPSLIDRFQLVVGGLEVVNGFAELNDPIDQRERFMTEEKKREGGDAEAQVKDEAYLEALEYGLPPACGWAIGIDRLIMLLTDTQNIREVIYFPTLRPRE